MDICSNPCLWNLLDFFTLYGYDPLPKGKNSKVTAARLTPVYGNENADLARVAEMSAKALAARRSNEAFS